jgi:acetate kinase
LAAGKIERIGEGKSHPEAIQEVLASVREHAIEAVGHRVVHGADRFSDPVVIDGEVIAAIEACIPLAPLHNPANLAGIRAAMEALSDVPQVAVFDTAFHHTLPRRARLYALDAKVAADFRIRRYGFHGTSHDFVSKAVAKHLKTPVGQLRLITCHLGNGASVCAVENGHSVETSMGMTPLEGLVMGTRSGDMDPGVVLMLLRSGDMSIDDVDELLNKRSGLKGLSGHSNDLRDLEERAADGDDPSRLAIAVFAHRVRKYIGAYAATMGGVDAVVLTGGIGENAVAMRRRILQRFEYLGLCLDEERNSDARVSADNRVADISADHSRVKALVAATDEELEIATQTADVVGGFTGVKQPGSIPIAISARHIHLERETFEKLFGPDAELTARNPLSQPGQFAADQTVNLIGPRRRLDKVRILGPLRKMNQVEISRTDEFHLGVDAPIRRSGQVEGSAPITVEGPYGTVNLSEGLICAWRHIHMTPEDAVDFGVENGDEVAVTIAFGPRELVFGNVLIRVKSSYKLEMHIDTDEANAAELPRSSEGTLERLEGPVGALLSRRPVGGPGTDS